MSFHILNIIEPGCKGVLNVNDNDLPVRFAFIEKGHDTQDFDLFDLSDISDLLADFADIKGIAIALGLGLSMRLGGVLPGLCIM